MDIRCQFCGEPWDIDSLHDEIAAKYPDKPWYTNGQYDDEKYQEFFSVMRKDFTKRGCMAFSGANHNAETLGDKKNALYGILMEVAGDDIDFAASMMEEAEGLGL